MPYFFYQNGELVYDASFRDSKLYRRNDSQLNRIGRWFHNRLRTIQLLHQVQFVAQVAAHRLA